MSEICKICGTEKVEGKCPNAETHLKKMCLNCISCHSENDVNSCHNEDNLNDAVKKLTENVPSGYELLNFELKPLALKDATKKCKRWSLNVETILDEYKSLF